MACVGAPSCWSCANAAEERAARKIRGVAIFMVPRSMNRPESKNVSSTVRVIHHEIVRIALPDHPPSVRGDRRVGERYVIGKNSPGSPGHDDVGALRVDYMELRV